MSGSLKVPEDLRYLYDFLLQETDEQRDRYGTPLTRESGIELIERISRLEAENARLKVPVSDEEWPERREWGATVEHISRSEVDAIIAARAQEPPHAD